MKYSLRAGVTASQASASSSASTQSGGGSAAIRVGVWYSGTGGTGWIDCWRPHAAQQVVRSPARTWAVKYAPQSSCGHWQITLLGAAVSIARCSVVGVGQLAEDPVVDLARQGPAESRVD